MDGQVTGFAMAYQGLDIEMQSFCELRHPENGATSEGRPDFIRYTHCDLGLK